MDAELGRRLEAIERRLAALEGGTVAPADGPPAASPDATSVPPEDRPQYIDESPPGTPDTGPSLTDGPPLMSAWHNQRLLEKQDLLQARHDEWRPPAVEPPAPAYDLERVVGLKWAGWVGGIVLVIGTALGIKFAYDQGWFGGLTDTMRVALIAAGGVALLGLGEWVFRRINTLAASGFYGAGVAVLYLAVFAGQAWYGLFGELIAMTLLALVAGVGMAVAARADLVSVACLAIIGAVICPTLTGALDVRPAGFRVYLLAVQAMAIGLCAWRARPKWWALRGVALAATAYDLAIGTPGETVNGFVMPGVVFGLLAATVYQGELVYSTWRRPRGEPSEPVPGLVFSLLVTAVLVATVLYRMTANAAWVRGEMLVWLALATTTTGLFVARRSVSLTLLGRGYFVQSMALLALAVPVACHGPARLFGWMVLSVALAALARLTRDTAAGVAAIVVWLLAASFGGIWAADAPQATHVWLMAFGEAVPAATIVAAALALAGHLTACVAHALFTEFSRRPGDGIDVTAGLLLDAAAAAALGLTLVQFQSPEFATRAAGIYALGLWAASLTPALWHLRPVGLMALSVVAVKWAAWDVVMPRLRPDWKPAGTPFLNAQTATGLALAAAFATAGWVDRRRSVRPDRPAFRTASDTIWTALASAAFASVCVVLLVQADLVLAYRHAAGGLADWPGRSADGLCMTAIAAACVLGWAMLLRATLYQADRRDAVWRAGRTLAYLLAAKFMITDVIVPATWRLPPTPPAILNPQIVVGGLLLALLAVFGRRTRETAADPAVGLMTLTLLLVAGSAEIDRYALRQTDGPVWIVRQVGWSIYWGTLAVATLVAGFATRNRPLRLTALGLLGITLAKLVLVDMAGVNTGWRIVSFLGLGGLLLLTSVLYGRFRDEKPVGG